MLVIVITSYIIFIASVYLLILRFLPVNVLVSAISTSSLNTAFQIQIPIPTGLLAIRIFLFLIF